MGREDEGAGADETRLVLTEWLWDRRVEKEGGRENSKRQNEREGGGVKGGRERDRMARGSDPEWLPGGKGTIATLPPQNPEATQSAEVQGSAGGSPFTLSVTNGDMGFRNTTSSRSVVTQT